MVARLSLSVCVLRFVLLLCAVLVLCPMGLAACNKFFVLRSFVRSFVHSNCAQLCVDVLKLQFCLQCRRVDSNLIVLCYCRDLTSSECARGHSPNVAFSGNYSLFRPSSTIV